MKLDTFAAWQTDFDQCDACLRAGSHFDISININISIRNICVNPGYISIRLFFFLSTGPLARLSEPNTSQLDEQT